MIVTEIHIYTYQLPLKQTLQIGNNTLINREGAIICVKTNTDLQGFGEAAPLPGLHQQNLHDVINQLKCIIPLMIGTTLENIFETTNQLQKENYWFPSVRFAIESALLNLIETGKNLNVENPLPKPVQDKIFINTLVTGNMSNIKRRISRSLTDNYRSIKVKIGRQSLDDEINLVEDIRNIIGKRASLRLDANRGWTYEEAVTFANSLDVKSIEYVEEPLKDRGKLPDLYKKTSLPIALDESMLEISPDKYKHEDWINTLILKPSVIGSIQKTLQYINLAKSYGIKTVISDTFHTGIGLSFLIRLASVIDKPTPMGFDTYSWLDDDILIDRLPVENGCFVLKRVMDRCQNVDFSKIEKVG